MKVKLKSNVRDVTGLKNNVTYRVLGIEAGDYRILDESGDPVLFQPAFFEIIDPRYPSEWIVETGEAGDVYAYPKELMRPGFFEDWHDGEEETKAELLTYLNRMHNAEYDE